MTDLYDKCENILGPSRLYFDIWRYLYILGDMHRSLCVPDCNQTHITFQIIHLRKVLETYERKIGKLEEKVSSKERQLEQNVSGI